VGVVGDLQIISSIRETPIAIEKSNVTFFLVFALAQNA
jgi:hypothetical protein